jgi:hypothetical protein
MAFVPATLATKAMGVGDAEIQSSALIPRGVVKVDADAVDAGRDSKRDVKVCLMLRSLDVACEYQILLRKAPGGKSKKDKAQTPALDDVQASSSTE